MADSPHEPMLTTAPPDAGPDPQRDQLALGFVAKLAENSCSTAPVLTPASKFSEENSKRWIPCRPPPQPEPQSKPLAGKLYPNAVPGQQILLDGFNTDVLMMIIDHICSIEDPREPYYTPISSFDFRKTGSIVFCLSLVNKRLRAVTIPTLFKNVFRSSISMGDLYRRLRDIEGNPLLPSLPPVLSAIKTCDIVTTSMGNITGCRTRLAKTLPRMKFLTEFSTTHRKDVDISGLQVTFQREEVTLSSITHLRILSQGSWEFLVKACPDVEILSLAHNLYHDDLLRTVSGLKRLKHLEICSDSWRNEEIERLHQFVPGIHKLTLRGSIGHECPSNFVDSFSSFAELTELFMTTLRKITDIDMEAQGSEDFADYDIQQRQSELTSGLCGGCITDLAPMYLKKCRKLSFLGFTCNGNLSLCWGPSRSEEDLEPMFIFDGPRHAIMDTCDWDGFPIVFSFGREIDCSDDICDPLIYLTMEEEEKRIEVDDLSDQTLSVSNIAQLEFERYDGIKQEAISLGLWD
ncbi:hypothetical protein TUN199_03845 [Pyrenophora tritici-repentis]|uniref:Uncharacterized protein n=1 Tax=Pyrenophora tritici-repentis (strain Pt-1C-BFP) TaxID=426418 RepID=B2W8H8_PYRTR|nr:uncharacterized protein PTRG_06286 [Pyrenophora tritici-repentis Pt-1C-BFP]EDU49206.1 predicted protein [Pyrenophora tritici-repentis Pt-1C-BFP]KAI0611966.1 hypothetical protein TUN205_03765 [Pyrenophora tritici-repentis]KAI0624134.1 hypothetical protein TUN199_03845 [Pyrenophora tritici-repentis]